MAWCLQGTKPLLESMMTKYSWVITRPQWVKPTQHVSSKTYYFHDSFGRADMHITENRSLDTAACQTYYRHYIPWNMHTVLLCFVLLWSYYQLIKKKTKYLPQKHAHDFVMFCLVYIISLQKKSISNKICTWFCYVLFSLYYESVE